MYKAQQWGCSCGGLSGYSSTCKHKHPIRDSSSCLGYSSSHPALCLWPEKTSKGGSGPWVPPPTWEAEKKLLAPSFASAQLWPSQLFGKWTSGLKVSLFKSLPFKYTLILKKNQQKVQPTLSQFWIGKGSFHVIEVKNKKVTDPQKVWTMERT